jgi:transketolase
MKLGFSQSSLTQESLDRIAAMARDARGDILRMTTIAKSGHPGGSFSSIDLFLTLYACANIDPADPDRADRDRILVSHGHTSPAVYATLAALGFFPRHDAVAHFRQTGSLYEGHVERTIPGVEWSSGNLGQGLAAGCGMAIAARHLGTGNHVYVLMSDAEQAKGQVGEARRIAMRHGLDDLTVLIDFNRIQLSGQLDAIMPQDIPANYRADGWAVIECDGHDIAAVYRALREATSDGRPTMILAHTLMGKGVSFMEGTHEYHGKPLKEDEFARAMGELGLDADLAPYLATRAKHRPCRNRHAVPAAVMDILPGEPRLYAADAKTDNRSAFGKALADVAAVNAARKGATPILTFDCDLLGSVKTDAFAAAFPGSFYQCGVQEHATATAAGAASSQGPQVFYADFGVFAMDEVYNQHRLNDINQTNLKVVGTHVGLNVGEDGKTHQCIDYLGLTRCLPGFRTVVPADPNQTDKVVRWAAVNHGNVFIAMGRSTAPVITREDGTPFFGPGYRFEYGRADLIRQGTKGAILCYGALLHAALEARALLAAKGIDLALYNVSCPIDIEPAVIRAASETGLLVVFEDHQCATGLSTSIARVLMQERLSPLVSCHGVSEYAPSGDFKEVYEVMGLSAKGLVDHVTEIFGTRPA